MAPVVVFFKVGLKSSKMAYRAVANLSKVSNLNAFRGLTRQIPAMSSLSYSSGPGDDLGRGAGRGGGAGGSIREAGGGMGKREAGLEEEYFHRLQKEQLDKLHDHLSDEIEHHEKQLKHHKEAIEGIKKRIGEIKKK